MPLLNTMGQASGRDNSNGPFTGITGTKWWQLMVSFTANTKLQSCYALVKVNYACNKHHVNKKIKIKILKLMIKLTLI